jgi:lipopolysaccharide/colanic/teichoic acid biosynthesis glycosyltransferase
MIIGFFDTGKPLFIQTRVGQHKKPFKLIKFRTMHPNTKSVATHLARQSSITKFGGFLRKSKLDELPQLINVFKGDMSLVGPRPNLFNQEELIEERDKRQVYAVLPGITGLSQINEIDMSTPKELAISDQKMIESYNIKTYFYYIFATISGKGKGDRIKT